MSTIWNSKTYDLREDNFIYCEISLPLLAAEQVPTATLAAAIFA